MSENYEKMKEAMENCSWKSVLFYANNILSVDKCDYNAIFCRSFALFSTNNFRELESWITSLPLKFQIDENLLIIRCKALLANKNYSAVSSLLSTEEALPGTSNNIVPPEVINNSEILRRFKEECLFNLGKTEIPPKQIIKKDADDKLDSLHPKNITKCIVEAMMKKDPSKIQKFTLMTDKRSENDAYIITACACYKILCKEYDSGQAFLIKATEINPDCEIGWLCLIFLFMETGEWDQALSTLKSVNTRFPLSESAAMFGISIYLRSGSPSLAMPWIEKIGIVNDFVKHESAVAQMMDGSLGTALKIFMELENTSNEQDLRCTSSINAGHCLRRLGKFDEAIEHYNHALSFGYKQEEALASIAFTYHITGKIDDAITFYNKCLAIDPFHPFATKMLNLALTKCL